MTNYDASPMMADTPLSIEEVEALIESEGKPVLKDGRKLMHVLRRMRIAIVAYRQQIRSLNNDIQMVRAQSERSGAATTLHPRDAVRFLSPEQLSQLVEGHLREQLSVAERSMADARKARANANSELARARFAIASILEDASLTSEVRARFEQIMSTLPEDMSASSSNRPSSSPSPAPANSVKKEQSVEDLGDLFS